MNKQEISPPRVLAKVRIVFHNLIPQWTSSGPWQDEGAEQNQGNKIWNQSIKHRHTYQLLNATHYH